MESVLVSLLLEFKCLHKICMISALIVFYYFPHIS